MYSIYSLLKDGCRFEPLTCYVKRKCDELVLCRLFDLAISFQITTLVR